MRLASPRALRAIVGCAIALSTPPASAQPGAQPPMPVLVPDGDARPWARDVSDAEQAVARELYAQGNTEFAESRFAQALAKYKEAIRHWDHPAIRFNMVVCLINLDQPLEAKDNLDRSLAYGVAPLGHEAHAQALT